MKKRQRPQRPIEYFIDYDWSPFAHVKEHETLFSFVNDSGNYAFRDWWDQIGRAAYAKWVEENIDRLSELYD
jgi:hypothetical protein